MGLSRQERSETKCCISKTLLNVLHVWFYWKILGFGTKLLEFILLSLTSGLGKVQPKPKSQIGNSNFILLKLKGPSLTLTLSLFITFPLSFPLFLYLSLFFLPVQQNECNNNIKFLFFIEKTWELLFLQDSSKSQPLLWCAKETMPCYESQEVE